MPTIKDVASLSNTSVGTVSRFLNGYTLKEENKLRIESAIAKLDFKVNPIARGLKTNKTFTVGIIIPELSNVFTNDVIDSMESTFSEEGYSIIICHSRNNLNTEKEKIEFLKNNLVDGIIIMPVSNEGSHLKNILEDNIPLVMIDRIVKDLDCDAVIVDNINGTYSAVEEIINKGHKKIGIIAGPENVYTSYERIKGYSRALADYNIEKDDNLIYYSDYSVKGGFNGFNFLYELPTPPTAIVASNYYTTIGSIKAIIEKGFKLGEDISVFGYDNTDIFEIMSPPISSVIQPKEQIGRTAATLLLKRIRGEKADFPNIYRLKTEINVTLSIKDLNKN